MVKSRVSLISGDNRRANITAALEAIAADVKLPDAGPILIKPNLVGLGCPQGTTHVDAVRAVVEWLRARTDLPIVVGEGTALSSTQGAFEEYGYLSLPDEYPNLWLMDLNADEAVDLTAYSWRLRPMSLKASQMVTENRFRVSVAPPKTHDTVLVTLSLKNMVMGGLISQLATADRASGRSHTGLGGRVFQLGEALYMALPDWLRHSPLVMQAKELTMARVTPSSKAAMHQGFAAMHLNLFTMAPYFHPHLAVIDGFQAMEGNGPQDGDVVAWRMALASTDWLAADATTARLMGFQLEEVGYMLYCAQAGYGAADLADIEIVGNAQPALLARRFKRHDLGKLHYRWKSPAVSRHLQEALAVMD